ncbi:hypothetical protein [Nocardia xishanensis]
MKTAVGVLVIAALALAGCASESVTAAPNTTSPPPTSTIVVIPVGQYVITQPGTYVAGRDIPAGMTWTGLGGDDDCRYQRTWKGKPHAVKELRSALTFGDPADAGSPVTDSILILEGDSVEILGSPDSRPCVFWADTDQVPADSPAPWDGYREQVRSLPGWMRGEAAYLRRIQPQAPGVAGAELVDMGMWACWTDSKYGAREARTLAPLHVAMSQYAGLTEQQAAAVVDTARSLLCPR